MRATRAGEAQAERQQVPIPGMWPYAADITGSGQGTPRGRALSIYWAAQATDLPVTGFRSEHLDGKLLAADQIADWIGAQRAQEGRASWWLDDVPLDLLQPIGEGGAGGYRIPPEVMRSLQGRQTHRQLWYATGEHADASVAVHLDGVLDQMRLLAASLLQNYWQWAPYELAPYVMRASLQDIERSPFFAPLTARTATFVLTGYAPLIDERMLMEQHPLPEGSGRQQTEKALQLAALWVVREKEHVPLAERLVEWNVRYPQWRYGTTSNFARDGRDAVRRLIEPPERKRLKATSVRDAAAKAGDMQRAADYLATTGEDATAWWANAPFDPKRHEAEPDATNIVALLRDARRELADATSDEERRRVQTWIQELQDQLERIPSTSTREGVDRLA